MNIKFISGVFALFVIGGVLLFSQMQTTTDSSPVELGGDFSVRTLEGDVSLSDFNDQLVVLYFGYTSCPDVCPTSLTTMRFAFAELSKTELEKVQGLFISVDPDRDSLEHLATYAQFFSPNIIGASGTKQQIDQAVANFGAYYRLVDQSDSAMDYTVDHSSKIYLIGPDTQLIKALPHSSSPSELASLIKTNLP